MDEEWCNLLEFGDQITCRVGFEVTYRTFKYDTHLYTYPRNLRNHNHWIVHIYVMWFSDYLIASVCRCVPKIQALARSNAHVAQFGIAPVIQQYLKTNSSRGALGLAFCILPGAGASESLSHGHSPVWCPCALSFSNASAGGPHKFNQSCTEPGCDSMWCRPSEWSFQQCVFSVEALW